MRVDERQVTRAAGKSAMLRCDSDGDIEAAIAFLNVNIAFDDAILQHHAHVNSLVVYKYMRS